MRDYLIYTSAGEAANVKHWASSDSRNYDIWITNYSELPNLNRQYADHYNKCKGSKIPNLSAVVKQHEDIFRKYKAVMVADDDVIISPRPLSALFRVLEQQDLWMLQPAFSGFGKVSHKITQRRLKTSLRYVNFVEITCPIFPTEKLLEFLNVYTPEMATIVGIDYWLPYFFGIDQERKYAISDKYYCINPREQFKRVTSRAIDSVSSANERKSAVAVTLKSLGIRNFNYQEYSSIKRPIHEQLIAFPKFLLELAFQGCWNVASKIRQAVSTIQH